MIPEYLVPFIWALIYLLLAPVAGGLIAGIDRKVTARMQGRVGPPLLQPFYDVAKLFEKENLVVTASQNFFVLSYLVFMAVAGALFFSGGDMLLVIFAFTLSHIFLVLGAYASYSPYSHIGAERELLQIIAYEPMIILTAVGMFMVTKSFFVSTIVTSNIPIILYLPGVFIGYLIVLTIKLRKSPFDLSTSHHAHQELVKGVTTDFGGPNLGKIEVAHWYEYVFLLGVVWLFFAWNPIIAVAAIIIAYFLEILIDNTFARVKWQLMIRSAWIIAGTLGLVNLGVLYYLMTYLKKSPWLIHYDASSCNGCDIEVLAALSPLYDIERFGIINTGNPKHADIFLVTGGVNVQNKQVLINTYEQIPEPKVVIAIGICATSGGIYRECYNILGGIDKVIPVDVYVPGCAARPESIIDGVVTALGILEQKRLAMKTKTEIKMVKAGDAQ
jgi:ech hydrogenase subunit B